MSVIDVTRQIELNTRSVGVVFKSRKGKYYYTYAFRTGLNYRYFGVKGEKPYKVTPIEQSRISFKIPVIPKCLSCKDERYLNYRYLYNYGLGLLHNELWGVSEDWKSEEFLGDLIEVFYYF